MSSPKHLWSGDWEHESRSAQSSLPAPPPQAAEPPPPPEPPASSSTYVRRRIIALTVMSALLLVGVVYALTSGGSDPKTNANRTTTGVAQGTPTSPGVGTVPHVSTGPQPPTPTTTTSTTTTPADALGLQLALVPVNRVIVQAVVPGSPADQVGIGADDLLLTINGQRVTSPGQANGIIAKLPKGSQVTLTLVQGSEQIQATIQESNGP